MDREELNFKQSKPAIKLLLSLFFVFNLCTCNTANNKENNLINQNHETMNEQNLLINFILSRRETSKDSNSETIRIKVSKEKLVFEKKFGGFRAPKNERFEKKINIEKLNLINEFIQEHELNKDLNEQKETEGTGVAGYLKMEIFEPKVTTIIIEGKTSIWGSDDYIEKYWGKEFVESKTNVVNKNYFDKARSFVRFIEKL